MAEADIPAQSPLSKKSIPSYEEQLAAIESMMTCYDTPITQAAGYVRDLLRTIIALQRGEISGNFKCPYKNSGAGGNDPQDCEWPVCGCDPYAAKVVAAIEGIEVFPPKRESCWVSTKDRLPAKPGKASYEHVDCLVVYKGEVEQLMWNCEHLVWDDRSGDDFYCNPQEVAYWMPTPSPPEIEDGSAL